MSSCFGLKAEEDGQGQGPSEDQSQQKDDEKMALESIYGDAFAEKIPGKLWQFEMNIPVLQKLIQASNYPSISTYIVLVRLTSIRLKGF